MKKFIAILTALSIVFISSGAIAASEQYEDEDDPFISGLRVDSILEFEGSLNKRHETNSFSDVGVYLSTIDSIYIPEILKNHEN